MSGNRSSGGSRRSGDTPETLAGGQVAVLENETVWDGFVRMSRMLVDIPRFGGGRMQQMREVHDHGNAAVVLPVNLEERKVLLVRQWRIPPVLNGYDGPLLEAVAGLIDPGETAEDTVLREAVEETGHEISGLVKLFSGYSSPGTVTEHFHLFIGFYTSDHKLHDGGGLDHEEENMEVVELGFDELQRLFAAGEINDAKTWMAISHVLANYA